MTALHMKRSIENSFQINVFCPKEQTNSRTFLKPLLANVFSTFMSLVFLWIWDFRGGDHDHQRGTLSKGKKKGRNGGRKMKYTPRDELSLSCSDYIGTKREERPFVVLLPRFGKGQFQMLKRHFFHFSFLPSPFFLA